MTNNTKCRRNRLHRLPLIFKPTGYVLVVEK